MYFHSNIMIMILQEFFFNKYDIPLIEIKDFNALVNNKPLFKWTIKYKQGAYKQLMKF